MAAILRQVDHRVKQVDKPSQRLAKRSQAGIPELPCHKQLAHQSAEAVRRSVHVAGVRLFDLAQLRHTLLDRSALPRPARTRCGTLAAERL